MSHTAIIIFSDSPVIDARKKRLLPSSSRRSNVRFMQYLQERTLLCAQETGSPVLFINHKRQKGKSFGERISNAFNEAFQLGFQRAVLLGTDHAGCDSSALKKIISEFDDFGSQQAAILGPDFRGGSWLIGLDKDTFYQLALSEIPWHTTRVFSALQSAIKSLRVSVMITDELADLNHSGDLTTLIDQLGSAQTAEITQLLKVASSLIEKETPTESSALAKEITQRSTLSFRGPPSKMAA